MTNRLNDVFAAALSKLGELLGNWTEAQRLYTLSGSGQASELLVERYELEEEVSQPYRLELTVLSVQSRGEDGPDLNALLGETVTLNTRLSDGSSHSLSGLVMAARHLGGDGGFQRLQLTVRPWIALLEHETHSRAWQDKTLQQILDDVLGAPAYRAWADWRWGESDAGSQEDLAAFIARGPHQGLRPLCSQYRESDLHFLQRLLSEAGLGYRIEQADEALAGHRLVFFADSRRWPENASSTSRLGGTGLRFQRADAAEEQDAIQAFGAQRDLQPATTTLTQWDLDAKASVTASAPTVQRFAGDTVQDLAPWLEDYEPAAASDEPGASRAELQHLADLRQQAHEWRHKTWLGRSNVRTLRAGQRFQLRDSPFDALALDPTANDFSVHRVHALGINNLPRELSQHLAERLQVAVQEADPWAEPEDDDKVSSLHHDPELSAQAARTGHANRFEACRRAIPWRALPDARPSALGLQTALVVGPDGQPIPNAADELYTDALGRIRVQFHWQSAPHADPRPDNRSSCWVRVAQRWAGAGVGQQFIPRIGQEVLIQFLDGDIDRPLCLGAIHNGQGEGGIPPTPGGTPAETQTEAYAQSSDHRASAQGNRIGSGAGGHAPAWHGGAPGLASPDRPAQNNAAALSGVKSKEFGGQGSNQLVFDDTPGELRVQLASTQHASQLNLGHLVHQADNHRGSYRGSGFELRTDAYGSVRASQGLLVSSYGTQDATPAGDNAPGMALLKQAQALADTFSRAAATHQTTQLASSLGIQKAKSQLSADAAPLHALQQAASGMVGPTLDQALQDAGQRSTQAKDGQLPHSTDPIVAISAKAGLSTVAGQDLQWASGEAIALLAGQDTQATSGGQLRLHSGQSLGILAGVVQAGQSAKGLGLTAIAAHGPVQLQAQAGTAQLAAKGDIHLQSARQHLDFASASKITLQTTGGAKVVISASGIQHDAPGTLSVKATQKSFVGQAKADYPMPVLPQHICVECLLKARAVGAPFALR